MAFSEPDCGMLSNQKSRQNLIFSPLEDLTWKITSPQAGQKHHGSLRTLKDVLKFGSVSGLYSGVLALVGSGCGALRAAVTGCSLGWLNAWVSRCRACLTAFGAEAACSQRAVVTVLAATCVGDLGVDRGVKKTEMKG